MKNIKKLIIGILIVSGLYIGLFDNTSALRFFIELTSIFRVENMSFVEKQNLPIFKLNLSKNDMAHFEDIYKYYDDYLGAGAQNYDSVFIPYYQSNNKWRRATLFFRDTIYNVKIRAHGMTPTMNKYGKNISYKVKIMDNKKIRGASKFSLIIYWRIRHTYSFLKQLIGNTSILLQKDQLILLKINNWDAKLYFIEYEFDQEYLTEIYHSHKILLSAQDDKSMVYTGKTPNVDTTEFIKGIRNMNLQYKNNSKIKSQYIRFNRATYSFDSRNYNEFFDIDYISTYNALRLLGGINGHGFSPENLIVCFDTLAWKFFPVFHRDCMFSKLDSDNFHEKLNDWEGPINMLINIDANEILRMSTYKKLYNFIYSDYSLDLINNFDSVYDFHQNIFYSSKIKNLLGLGESGIIKGNVEILLNSLELAKPEFKYHKSKKHLYFELRPNSKSFLKFSKFAIGVSVSEKDSVIIKIERFLNNDKCKTYKLVKKIIRPANNIDLTLPFDTIFFHNDLTRKSNGLIVNIGLISAMILIQTSMILHMN
ncbi:MAG: hypothetical protein JKY33_07340 [Bacteroidia bacterium]|nr:hypothetical protein [Bacteroidia bacterium]